MARALRRVCLNGALRYRPRWAEPSSGPSLLPLHRAGRSARYRQKPAADPALPVTADAHADLAQFAHAMRAFGHSHSNAFRLVVGMGPVTAPPDASLITRGVAPLLRIAGELAGPDNALDAARTVTAWAAGFITMELGGAFNLGGDLDEAFEYGISRLAPALGADNI